MRLQPRLGPASLTRLPTLRAPSRPSRGDTLWGSLGGEHWALGALGLGLHPIAAATLPPSPDAHCGALLPPTAVKEAHCGAPLPPTAVKEALLSRFLLCRAKEPRTLRLV